MTDWQIVIPHLGPPDNLAGCLASMGEVNIPLLIVDNSHDSHTQTMELPGGTQVVYYPQNLGVAASWNLGLKRGARWTLICSASIRFGKGGLSHFIDIAAKAASSYGLLVYNGNGLGGTDPLGWHIIVIGHKTVETIGYFDENFYPAYYEDNDYAYRMSLARIAFCGEGPVFPFIIVPDLVVVGAALALASGYLQKGFNMQALETYFVRKWGGKSSHQTWKHPFNDETKGLDWWRPR